MTPRTTQSRRPGTQPYVSFLKTACIAGDLLSAWPRPLRPCRQTVNGQLQTITPTWAGRRVLQSLRPHLVAQCSWPDLRHVVRRHGGVLPHPLDRRLLGGVADVMGDRVVAGRILEQVIPVPDDNRPAVAEDVDVRRMCAALARASGWLQGIRVAPGLPARVPSCKGMSCPLGAPRRTPGRCTPFPLPTKPTLESAADPAAYPGAERARDRDPRPPDARPVQVHATVAAGAAVALVGVGMADVEQAVGDGEHDDDGDHWMVLPSVRVVAG